MPETTELARFSGALVPIDASDGPEAVIAKLEAFEAFKAYAKRVAEQLEQAAIERLSEIGAVRVGEMVYWAGLSKKPPKCVDVRSAVEALLNAVGGDVDKFTGHLGANALKYGACRATLPPEQFDQLFRQEEVVELQSDEAAKAAKRLQKAPAYMLEQRKECAA